jgi:hypothetical protein
VTNGGSRLLFLFGSVPRESGSTQHAPVSCPIPIGDFPFLLCKRTRLDSREKEMDDEQHQDI